MSPRHRTLIRVGAVCASAMLAFAACGSDSTGSGSASTEPPTSAVATTEPSSVPILGVYDGVEAYPACGNTPLEYDGVVWFPLFNEGYDPPSDAMAERAEEVRAVVRDATPVATTHGLVRVAPPGPGDDVGTLVVWADGVARWTSDSGDLDVWLVDDELTYDWVC